MLMYIMSNTLLYFLVASRLGPEMSYYIYNKVFHAFSVFLNPLSTCPCLAVNVFHFLVDMRPASMHRHMNYTSGTPTSDSCSAFF